LAAQDWPLREIVPATSFSADADSIDVTPFNIGLDERYRSSLSFVNDPTIHVVNLPIKPLAYTDATWSTASSRRTSDIANCS